ncbi:MAG: beta-eliminating lyase-related protein, partial [Pseudobdellovibrionaceae bacterium]|nr:beta-eliminating lyase-related protein [Pseudobdellovibrionaceae bacterium]
FFVFTGTAANTLAIRGLCRPYEAVVATSCAHLNEDECGAPEYISGNKILSFPLVQGKLTLDVIERLRINPNDPHRVLPRLVSLTQATELGTVYSLNELRALTDLAHKRGMLVHMDGARLANAAVYLNCDLADVTTAVGVDAVSFGGTKNGLLCAEALVFLKPDLAPSFAFIRKQSMQLASKMRYLSCQFLPYLQDQLWKKNATQANTMALYLRQRLSQLQDCEIPYPTQANEVFAILPPTLAKHMQEKARAYAWDGPLHRFVTSFDTTKADVDALF